MKILNYILVEISLKNFRSLKNGVKKKILKNKDTIKTIKKRKYYFSVKTEELLIFLAAELSNFVFRVLDP